MHVQVQTVTPSWEPPGKEYWLEVVTQAPVTIVATGEGEKLEFDSGAGEVALIPSKQLKKGRFEYTVAGAEGTGGSSRP